MAIAASWMENEKVDMSGFQAEAAGWEYLRGWNNIGNKCGMSLLNYDDMLYSKNGYKFNDRKIDQNIFKNLQKEAKNLLDTHPIDKKEKAHLEGIVAGIPPFGFTIEEDEQ